MYYSTSVTSIPEYEKENNIQAPLNIAAASFLTSDCNDLCTNNNNHSNVLIEGVLSKRSRSGLFWLRRWVTVTDCGELFTSKSRGESTRKKFDLTTCMVRRKDAKHFNVHVADGTNLHFTLVDKSSDCSTWVEHIQSQIREECPSDTDHFLHRCEVVTGQKSHIASTSAARASTNKTWNDYFQLLLEHNNYIDDEETKRDDTSLYPLWQYSYENGKQLKKLMHEFHTQAKRGTMIIIDEYILPTSLKTIKPIDAHDRPESQVYLYHGILFSFCHNDKSRQLDDVAMKRATHELHGLSAYINSQSHLSIPLTCVTDYQGFRMQCVAPPPIYNQEHLVYGLTSTSFREHAIVENALREASTHLHLKEHSVYKNKEHSSLIGLTTSIDAEVYECDDNRYYLQHCYSVLPIDYAIENITSSSLSSSSVEHYQSSNMKRFRCEFLSSYPGTLSSNVFQAKGPRNENDHNDIRAIAASSYLRQRIIPEFIRSLDMLKFIPLTGVDLCRRMQQRGINVRYLGLIASTARLPHIREIALIEMIARACKKMLQRNLRKLTRKIIYEQTSNDRVLHDTVMKDGNRDSIIRQDEEEDGKQQQQQRALKHNYDIQMATIYFFNVILGTGDTHNDAWIQIKRILAQHYSYDNDILRKSLEWYQLFLAMQHHCGVMFSVHTYEFGMQNISEPINENDYVSTICRIKSLELHTLACHAHALAASKYIRRKNTESAVTSLNAYMRLLTPSDKWNMMCYNLTRLADIYVNERMYDQAKRCVVKILQLSPHLHPYTACALLTLMVVHFYKGYEGLQLYLEQHHHVVFNDSDGSSSVNNDDLLHKGRDHKEHLKTNTVKLSTSHTNLLSARDNNNDDPSEKLHSMLLTTPSNPYDIVEYNDNTTYHFMVRVFQCHEVAIEIIKVSLGSFHPIMLTAYSELATLLVKLPNMDIMKAEELYQSALDLSTSILGHSHPVTAKYCMKLGELYTNEKFQQWNRARQMLERALDTMRKHTNNTTNQMADCYAKLCHVMSEINDYDQAITYGRSALAAYEDTYGAIHHKTMNICIKVGEIAEKADKSNVAIMQYEWLLVNINNARKHAQENDDDDDDDDDDEDKVFEKIEMFTRKSQALTKKVLQICLNALDVGQKSWFQRLKLYDMHITSNKILLKVVEKLNSNSPSTYFQELLAQTSAKQQRNDKDAFDYACKELSVLLQFAQSSSSK